MLPDGRSGVRAFGRSALLPERTERPHVRTSLAGLLLVLLWAPTVHAQASQLSGHALRVTGTDTVPLARASVVLHRLSARDQGPVDSSLTAADGSFRFRALPDTQALLLVSTRYSGIEYFSRPVRLAPGASDPDLLILAADTSSTAPIAVAARYLVINRPGPGGARGVLDLIVLQNRGGLTRVAPDTSRPSWHMRLPAGILGFEVGDGEVSAAAVGRAGDTLTIASPFPPGERQLVVTYALPGGRDRFLVPLEFGADSTVFLLEEADARVTTPGFRQADSSRIEGRTYQRWIATGVKAGDITLRVTMRGQGSRNLLYAFAAALAAALLVALAWLVRRPATRPAPVAVTPPDPGTPAMLIEQLAQLDRHYHGREAEVSAVEWAHFQARRARLLADYEAARRGRP